MDHLSTLDFICEGLSVITIHSEQQSIPPIPKPGDLITTGPTVGGDGDWFMVLDIPNRYYFKPGNVTIEVDVERLTLV